jgi:hypothetical protein
MDKRGREKEKSDSIVSWSRRKAGWTQEIDAERARSPKVGSKVINRDCSIIQFAFFLSSSKALPLFVLVFNLLHFSLLAIYPPHTAYSFLPSFPPSLLPPSQLTHTT